MPKTIPKNLRIDRRADEVSVRQDGNPDDLLNTSEVSEWTGLSVSWFEIARHKGFGPRYVRLSSRSIRYRRSDIHEWLSERSYQRTSEYLAREA